MITLKSPSIFANDNNNNFLRTNTYISIMNICESKLEKKIIM